jgi:hypothetical protein
VDNGLNPANHAHIDPEGTVNKLRIAVLLGAAFTLACSSLSINYDFDPDADFSSYRSYAWLEKTTPSQNSLMDKRIMKAADFYLARAGMSKLPDAPELYVVHHVGTQDKVDVTSYGYGYGGRAYRPYGYGGGGGVDVTQYTEGTLILDLIDASTKQLVWRGTAKDTVDPGKSPEAIQAKLDQVFEAMFQNYPPPK